MLRTTTVSRAGHDNAAIACWPQPVSNARCVSAFWVCLRCLANDSKHMTNTRCRNTYPMTKMPRGMPPDNGMGDMEKQQDHLD